MTIKEARTLAGWTQAKMSAELKISRRNIEDWERGVSNPPEWAERLVVREILRNVRLLTNEPLDGDKISFIVYEDHFEIPTKQTLNKNELDAAFWDRVDTCEQEIARFDSEQDALLCLLDQSEKTFSTVEKSAYGMIVTGIAAFVRAEEVDADGEYVRGGDVLFTEFGSLL